MKTNYSESIGAENISLSYPTLKKTKPTLDKTSLPRPQTLLGKKLMKLRKRIVASGGPLLGWKEIEQEVTVRRGGIG